MMSVVILTLFGSVLLFSSTISGGSKLEYFNGRQNPATHFPTGWPFTIPPEGLSGTAQTVASKAANKIS